MLVNFKSNILETVNILTLCIINVDSLSKPLSMSVVGRGGEGHTPLANRQGR